MVKNEEDSNLELRKWWKLKTATWTHSKDESRSSQPTERALKAIQEKGAELEARSEALLAAHAREDRGRDDTDRAR